MEPFYGEIRMFGGNYSPRNWAMCDGQTLSIGQNAALFSLISTAYGGDGRVTFALPDMRGRLPVNQGTGYGLTPRPMGQRTGVEGVSLSAETMPSHSHPMQVSSDVATDNGPEGLLVGRVSTSLFASRPIGTKIKAMADEAVIQVGSGKAHDNLMPYQCLTFIICTQGAYPERNP